MWNCSFLPSLPFVADLGNEFCAFLVCSPFIWKLPVAPINQSVSVWAQVYHLEVSESVLPAKRLCHQGWHILSVGEIPALTGVTCNFPSLTCHLGGNRTKNRLPGFFMLIKATKTATRVVWLHRQIRRRLNSDDPNIRCLE